MSKTVVQFPGNLASAESLVDLRQVPTWAVRSKANIIVQGGMLFGDGDGGVYSWDPAANDADNGVTTIRPSDRTPSQVGRWIKVGSGPGPVTGGGIWDPDSEDAFSRVDTEQDRDTLLETVLGVGIRVWNNVDKQLHVGDGATMGGIVVGSGGEATSISIAAPPYLADPTGAANATQAIKDANAAADAAGGTDVFAPAGQYKSDDRTLLQRQYSGPGVLKILGATVPMGDVNKSVAVEIGPDEAFRNPDEFRRYIEDRRIRPTAIVTAQVLNGQYDMPGEFYARSPDWNNVDLAGNEADPALCTLRFPATGNGNGFKADSCHLRVRGFAVVGIGAIGPTKYDWNADSYGAAYQASGSGSRISGFNIQSINFYYGMLAQEMGSISAIRGFILRAGDCGVLARQGSFAKAEQFVIQDVAHKDQYGVNLGYGALAEGGFIDVLRSEASGCLEAGVGAQAGGQANASGFNAHDNENVGALCRGASQMTLAYDVPSNAGIFAVRNGRAGIVCEDVSLITLYGGGSDKRIQVYQNGRQGGPPVTTADGLVARKLGRIVGDWVNVTDNTGAGLRVDGTGSLIDIGRGFYSNNTAGNDVVTNGGVATYTNTPL